MPDIDEKTFEQSMAEAALAALKSKAPALVEYMMGFQLIDKSEDDTRAAGFFGFKVGDRWVYGPVFFLNGEVKGLEMMYAKDEDKFLPLEEGWIAYLTKKRKFSLGETKQKNDNQLSVAGPDFRPYNRPPNIKVSADDAFHVEMLERAIGAGCDEVADWSKEAAEQLKECKPGQWPEALRLPKVAARMGITRQFLEDCTNRPQLGKAVLAMYNGEDFLKAEAEQNQPAKTAAKVPDVGEVMILDSSNVTKDRGRAKFLSKDQKETILKGNTVVVDTRPEDAKRKVYKYESTLRLESPKTGGMYDMLTSDGGMKKVLILKPQVIGHGAVRDIRLVVDPENGNYALHPASSIFVSHEYERADYKEALEGMGSDLASASFDVTKKPGDADWDPKDSQKGYVVIFPNGDCVVPFKVHQKFENNNGTSSLLVEPSRMDLMAIEAHNSNSRMRGLENISAKRHGGTAKDSLPFDGVMHTDNGIIDMDPDGGCDYDAKPNASWEAQRRMRLILTPKPMKRPLANGSSLLLPTGAGARVMKVKPTETEIDPGTTADLHLGIEKQASQLKIYSDGLALHITCDSQTKVARSDREALEALMADFGTNEEDARSMLNEGRQLKSASQVRFWVEHEKTAAPFDKLFHISRSDPNIDAAVQESIGPSELRLPEYESKTDPNIYKHHKDENNYHAVYQQDIEDINQAASSGQQDVFDASALGSLIKVQNPDEEIESYIGDMIQGLDKLGRTLFLIYWHNEDLQERYGKQDLRDTEDQIKSSFQSLGEVILDLRKKSPTDIEAFGRGMLNVGNN